VPYYLNQPIRIADYDQHWPLLYEQEEIRLQATLSPVLLSIEHIGSTSVSGLAAKPIIDMLAGVGNLEDIAEHVPALDLLGYEDARINPAFRRRMFCKGRYNEGSHHLHVVVFGSDQWLSPLRFRDYLRTHGPERTEYAELKRQLARIHETDLDAYSEGKGAFVEAILAAASGL
jgi:GrpB-like predicted nucleotidyltransferase (UPF0157 family)